MSAWKVNLTGRKPKFKKPVLIEGLPGIGNVGKIAVDFIIEEYKAKKLYEFSSDNFPHTVFVNENNLVELPKIELYYVNLGKNKNDLLLLAGDVQPIDEESCYQFCYELLKVFKECGGKEIITIGGIGLENAPKKPKVFCTGNSKDIIKKYKRGTSLNEKLYGIVGPIVGVTGLLLGLAEKEKTDAIAMLAETFGHPLYLGIKGSREVLKVLNKKLSLKLNMKDLDKEIEEMEKEMLKRTDELSKISKKTAMKKLKGRTGEETSYIG